ncbi:unnamed protein product [Moneuplotes crassus]|uniref:Uncharacterized protein n=1 Tax=Euplotes crassus TaxID=5936 RepID=A0AAD1UAP9_EUPCR|nr:unnamed protein product [Moneuplotes crassus]
MKTSPYKRRIFGNNRSQNQRRVSPDQSKIIHREFSNSLILIPRLSSISFKRQEECHEFRLGKICNHELSLQNLYTGYKPSDTEGIGCIPFDQIMNSKVDPEKTLEDLMVREKKFISPKINQKFKRTNKQKKVIKMNKIEKIRGTNPRKYPISKKFSGSVKSISENFFVKKHSEDKKNNHLCSIIDNKNKQHADLKFNYNSFNVKSLKSDVLKKINNSKRKIISNSPSRTENRVKFNIKLPIDSKIVGALPSSEKHKALAKKSLQNRAHRHNTRSLHESFKKVVYNGVEIIDYTDLYELLNFNKETPRMNLALLSKFNNRKFFSERNKFENLLQQKTTPSVKEKKNLNKIDAEFYKELQKHQVVKNRWESRLGDKLLLIEKMDSYEPHKREMSLRKEQNIKFE